MKGHKKKNNGYLAILKLTITAITPFGYYFKLIFTVISIKLPTLSPHHYLKDINIDSYKCLLYLKIHQRRFTCTPTLGES